jgi:hypothetical protein
MPRTGLQGLLDHWRSDIVFGFLVFLIALPLCLGIVMGWDFPPMAGIISAVIGGVLVSRINGSYVTINHEIPLASLAALLVYTGFRLASPREFVKTLDIGKEQLVLFCITIAGGLATDLLAGVFIGILAKLAIHILRGVDFKNPLKINYTLTQTSPGVHHFCHDYVERGGRCDIRGLEKHQPYSNHPLAARRRKTAEGTRATQRFGLETVKHG